MFIVRPDITDEELDPFIEQIRTVVTTSGGTIDKVEKMGVRRLAYAVNKKDDGYYVLVQFTSNPQLVRELERRLRV
jgi:small subunit ribosomal protein S6